MVVGVLSLFAIGWFLARRARTAVPEPVVAPRASASVAAPVVQAPLLHKHRHNAAAGDQSKEGPLSPDAYPPSSRPLSLSDERRLFETPPPDITRSETTTSGSQDSAARESEPQVRRRG